MKITIENYICIFLDKFCANIHSARPPKKRRQSESKIYESTIQISDLLKKLKKFGLGADFALTSALPPVNQKFLQKENLHLLNDERIRQFLYIETTENSENCENEEIEIDLEIGDFDIPEAQISKIEKTENEIEAERIKELGNAAYKEKNFDEALKARMEIYFWTTSIFCRKNWTVNCLTK